MVKLVALDIDGTLTDAYGEIDSDVIDRLHQLDKRQIKIALVSGRPVFKMMEVAQKLQLAVYHISNLGAIIQDSTQAIWQRHFIDRCVAQKVGAFASRMNIPFSLSVAMPNQSPTQTFVVPGSVKMLAAIDVWPISFFIEGDRAAAVMYQYGTAHWTDQLYVFASLSSDGHYRYTQIVHSLATKGNAVSKLGQMLNINQSNILSIGNGESDIPLFQSSGISIAVSNALPHVQNSAKYVAPFPYGRGVLWALDKIKP